MNFFRSFVTGIVALGFVSAVHAEVVVVVSAKSPVGALTQEQVAQIFLGKTAAFPSGGQAIPVDQNESSSVRAEFYTKVTGKDGAQLKAYWAKQIFTNKGQPPKEVPSNGDVKKLVADNPSVIGYLDKSAVDGSVKVVLGL